MTGSNGHGDLSELPEGWRWKTLSELGTWTGGGTPSKKRPEFWEDGLVPWVSPKDMKQVRLESTEDHITQAAVAESAAKLFPANSIAFVVRSGILAHTLPVALIPFEATANQDMRVLTPRDGVNPEWLVKSIGGVADDILRSCRKHGTTVASVEVPRLQAYSIAVPPREEQTALSEYVDVQLRHIHNGERDVRVVKARLARYRAASISAVLSGSLAGFDGDVAEDLARAERRPLGEQAVIQYGWTAKATTEDVGPRLLRITDIQKGRVDWNTVPYCEIPDEKLASYRLRVGDIVFARSGATTGKSYLVGDRVPEAVFASYLIRVRPNEALHPRFLALFFQGAEFWRYVREHSRGMAQPNLNGTLLGELKVPFPSREAQAAAIAAAEHHLHALEHLEREMERVTRGATQLQNGVLRAAALGGIRSVPVLTAEAG